MKNFFRVLFYVVGGSVILSSCSLFGGKGGKPTASNPGQTSSATGLAYNDEDAGGFMVKPFRAKDVLIMLDVALYLHQNRLPERKENALAKNVLPVKLPPEFGDLNRLCLG